jgi:hypothetical protein
MLPDYSITIESPSLAQLTVLHARDPQISLTPNLHKRTYNVGYVDAPLFRLNHPFSPDDPWRIDLLPRGRYLEARREKRDYKLIGAIRSWLPPEMLDTSDQLFSSLPAGQYILVRVPLRPSRTETIILGNRRVTAPHNVSTISELKNTYSYIWSTGSPNGPRLPLLGVPILNYSGESSITRTLGVHFFSLAPPIVQPELERLGHRDHLLVVPKSQKMAIDNVWSETASNEWYEYGARKFANRCLEE